MIDVVGGLCYGLEPSLEILPFAVVFTPGTPVLPTSTSARWRYSPNITYVKSKDFDTIIAGSVKRSFTDLF